MELDKVLDKVRKLIAKAEDEGTTPEEAKALQEGADALMFKYAIDEAQLDKTRPQASRTKPARINIELTVDHTLIGYMSELAQTIANHTSCRIRHYTGRTDWVYHSTVYGFESDLRYFEIMYTTLRLHMVGALRPHIDPNKTLVENIYNLHNAGMNWDDLVKEFGWRRTHKLDSDKYNMYVDKDGNRQPIASDYRTMYMKEVKRRGETNLKVGSSETFRRSSADGYISRIAQRLREIRDNRPRGNELQLRVSDLDAYFKLMNPDLFQQMKPSEPIPECENCKKAKSGHCHVHRPVRYRQVAFSQSAYEAGMKRANTAELNPAASHNPAKGIA